MPNPTLFLVIFGVIVVGIAGALIYIGVRNPQNYDDHELQARLDDFNQRGETIDLEKIELSLPFTERVIYPMARKLGEIAIQFTPQNALQSIAQNLELAGNPGRMDPTMFLALQFITALVFGGLLILAFSFGKGTFPLGQRMLFSIGGFIIGFLFPRLWITSKINAAKNIRKAMPRCPGPADHLRRSWFRF